LPEAGAGTSEGKDLGGKKGRVHWGEQSGVGGLVVKLEMDAELKDGRG